MKKALLLLLCCFFLVCGYYIYGLISDINLKENLKSATILFALEYCGEEVQVERVETKEKQIWVGNIWEVYIENQEGLYLTGSFNDGVIQTTDQGCGKSPNGYILDEKSKKFIPLN